MRMNDKQNKWDAGKKKNGLTIHLTSSVVPEDNSGLNYVQLLRDALADTFAVGVSRHFDVDCAPRTLGRECLRNRRK